MYNYTLILVPLRRKIRLCKMVFFLLYAFIFAFFLIGKWGQIYISYSHIFFVLLFPVSHFCFLWSPSRINYLHVNSFLRLCLFGEAEPRYQKKGQRQEAQGLSISKHWILSRSSITAFEMLLFLFHYARYLVCKSCCSTPFPVSMVTVSRRYLQIRIWVCDKKKKKQLSCANDFCYMNIFLLFNSKVQYKSQPIIMVLLRI